MIESKYSGKRSEKFWAKIKQIEDDTTHSLLYSAGCALQDHEQRVLEMLDTALSSQEQT